ncbi:TonB-dependent receptor domain-containing protein [Marinobacter sp. CA1]|uniref:TonB-dependent receptor domain-containing protein n=1 Tax=Marinobacter sp. CA1 TaxID=2817656 RepID=UPI001D08E9A3|nr:TonB-dependent receptor [Marinobacter sp. CA1]UDL06267.1 TonB-dependent receptor [Marinobacter sp. CA1]
MTPARAIRPLRGRLATAIALTSLSAAAQANTTSLPTLVVTASGYEQEVAEAPASISVISREELESRAYRDVTDALQDIPGVGIEGGPGGKATTAEVSIRGMDSQYTLIMVDGRAQGSGQGYYNGEGGGAEFGWLPPLSAIERIEVIRGPMSSLHGSDALGGVINIITRKVPGQWRGSLTLDTVIQGNSASGDRRELRYYLGGPLVADTLALTVYGSRFQRDEDEIANGYRERDKEDTTGKLTWTPSADQAVTLEAGYGKQQSEGTEAGVGRASDKVLYRHHQSFSHELHWGSNETQSYVQRETLDNQTQNAVYERVTVDTRTNLPFNSHQLTVGAQYRTQETENPSRAKLKANLQRWDAALFAEDEWFLSDDFSLTGGARWVKDENYGNELTPRLYGVYRLAPEWTVKGGISTGYRTPDLKEGDSRWVEGGGGPRVDGADVGNSDLKPETSLNYEAGVAWDLTNGFSGSLTTYFTQFDDKIEKPLICEESAPQAYDCSYLGTDYQKVYQYQNVEEAELKGVELTLGYRLGAVQASANYTFADSEQKTGANAGIALNNQPRHRANLGLDWQATAALNVWGKVKYKGETLETVGRRGVNQYPSYTFVDTGLNFQWGRHAQFYAGVYNLFDKEIRYDEYSKVLDGRRYNAGVVFSF